ncbi:MAG: NAD(P)-binding protein, partial [Myxococcaceae bacterium]
MPTLPPRPRIAPGPSRHVYDVLVLGAELGGALAAALLAKRGLRVLWAEHAQLAPGYEHDGFLFTSPPYIVPPFRAWPMVE